MGAKLLLRMPLQDNGITLVNMRHDCCGRMSELIKLYWISRAAASAAD
jgi:hypothetical protein